MHKLVSVTALFAIVLWVGSLTVSRIHAQDVQQPAARPVTRGTLTESTLVQMLEDLRYEPRKLRQGYVVTIREDDWTYNVQLVISPNGEKIGLNANIGVVDDPVSVRAADWQNVLAENTAISPSFFYYNKANRTLYMHRVIDNRCVTATILRQQIQAFTEDIRESADAWKFVK